MSTKPGEIKVKKRKRKVIPEVGYRLRIVRVHEAVCMECGEIVKESTKGYKELLGKHTCGICGAKFIIIETPAKKDGRGRVVNKDLARDIIIRSIERSGPISARKLRDLTSLNWVATRKIIAALSEEDLIEHTPKGWILVE